MTPTVHTRDIDLRPAFGMMPAMSRSILIVDDDPHIRELLDFALTKAGYATRQAEDGVAALAAVEEQAPDLVVLDINMPRLDGLEVCRRLRAQGNTPILFLSSRDDEIDRVLGIELGADDYVVKPFSPREVTARISAILRRSQAAPAPVAAPGSLVSHGRLTLDTDGWTATWAGQEVALTVTEFGILKALAAAPTRVFTRDAITACTARALPSPTAPSTVMSETCGASSPRSVAWTSSRPRPASAIAWAPAREKTGRGEAG